MENVGTITTVLSSLISILGLTYLVFWRFVQLRIDEFRQNTFILRDELFDYAAKGNISFDHPAYATLRSLMNGYIRFSHRVSLTQFLCITMSTILSNQHYFSDRFSNKWKDVIKDLDEKTKQDLERFQERASMLLFQYLFLSSFTKRILVFFGLGILILISELLEKDTDEVKVKESNRKLSFALDAGAPPESEVLRLKYNNAWAYQYSANHSETFRESIDLFNAGAYAVGK